MGTQIPARLGFVVVTNHDVPLISTAIFKTASGETVIVDRNSTEWDFDKIDGGLYRMEMIWRCCYIWDGVGNYMDWNYPFDNGFEFVGFELDDDAPENYFVNAKIVSWFDWGICNDKNV